MTALTEVELYFLKGKIERWICFGAPLNERTLDRRRRIAYFAPGSIFAFVRWASNGYGTLVSRIDILRACKSIEPYSTVPAVKPGAEILLRAAGWDKVQRVLRAIDSVEVAGLCPARNLSGSLAAYPQSTGCWPAAAPLFARTP